MGRAGRPRLTLPSTTPGERGASAPLPDPIVTGLKCRCPRCGEGALYSGFLKVTPRCESCGLDLAFADSGDGPAVFVIFAVAPIVMILAFIVEALFHPAPWMHLVLWIPTIIILSLWFLRPFKATMIALQYQKQAGSA